MSLRAFHITFIVAAQVVMLTFGTWCLKSGSTVYPRTPMALLGSISLVVGVAVLVYGAVFIRRIARPEA